MGTFFRNNITGVLRTLGVLLGAFLVWFAASGAYFFVNSARALRDPELIKTGDIGTFDLAGAEKAVKGRGK